MRMMEESQLDCKREECCSWIWNQTNRKFIGRPHIVDELLNNRVNLLVNTTEGRQSIEDSASIRRTALQNKLFCVTTIFGAFALLEAMSTNSDNWIYNSLQEIN